MLQVAVSNIWHVVDRAYSPVFLTAHKDLMGYSINALSCLPARCTKTFTRSGRTVSIRSVRFINVEVIVGLSNIEGL
jgi:hypothetical protein